MANLVIVKYHGIKLGTNEDGTPKLLKQYNAGDGLIVNIGGITPPIDIEEALRLKRDFGDAFEIINEVEVEVDGGNNSEWSITNNDMETNSIDNATFVRFPVSKPDSNEIIVKRKTKFDKTVKKLEPEVEYPDKLSKSKLGLMRKSELKKLYRTWNKLVGGNSTISRKATKADIIAEILIFQTAV